MSPAANQSDQIKTDAEASWFDRIRYPWDDWFNGRGWILIVAQHFPNCKSFESAYALIRNAAWRRGVRLRCRCHKDRGEIAIKAIKHDAQKTAVENVEEKGTSSRSSVRNGASSTQRRKLKRRK